MYQLFWTLRARVDVQVRDLPRPLSQLGVAKVKGTAFHQVGFATEIEIFARWFASGVVGGHTINQHFTLTIFLRPIKIAIDDSIGILPLHFWYEWVWRYADHLLLLILYFHSLAKIRELDWLNELLRCHLGLIGVREDTELWLWLSFVILLLFLQKRKLLILNRPHLLALFKLLLPPFQNLFSLEYICSFKIRFLIIK